MPPYSLMEPSAVTTAQVGSNTYLFVTGQIDNGVSVFQVSSDGSLVNVYNITDNATLQLDRSQRCNHRPNWHYYLPLCSRAS